VLLDNIIQAGIGHVLCRYIIGHRPGLVMYGVARLKDTGQDWSCTVSLDNRKQAGIGHVSASDEQSWS
jgi:hypothetical protein